MLGIFTLSVAIALQLVYTTFCLIRKSWQPRMKHVIRVAGLGAMALLLALRVYEWSVRWIPFVAVLSILTAASLVSLLVKAKEKPFRKGKAIAKAIGGVFLIAIALLPAIVFPQYRHPAITGAYEVATAEYSYVDETRVETYSATGENREVNVALWYPKDVQGQFPLVVFSHGFCGIKDSNESTFMELASHGYVVCSIDHPYHSFYTQNSSGKVTTLDMNYMNEYASLTDDKVQKLRTFQKWMNIRVSDISFVIDTILDSKGGVYDLVDRAKIGVFGHSLGGAAAMGVPRVRGDISAVVNIDAPMMCELIGVENGSYTINPEPYPAPLLHIYSQYLYDNGILNNDPDYFENRIVSATAPASYEVVFRGTEHMSLTDLVLFSPILANMLNSGRKAEVDPYYCIETMNGIILEFFDCYLKGSGTFNSAGMY